MSQLANPHWIAFNGEPITGRTPPTVIVYGPPMTPQQQVEVAHAYRLFTTANLLALGGYQVRNRTLSDGTRVRMLSINGVDTVQVWTVLKEEENELEFEGFVLVPTDPNYGPNWQYVGVWGAPFNESNSYFGAKDVRGYLLESAPPKDYYGSIQTILTPKEKDGSTVWKSYRFPKYDTVYKKPHGDVRAGNIDWVGPANIRGIRKKPILTFFGPENRSPSYAIDTVRNAFVGAQASAIMDDIFDFNIYYRGKVLSQLPAFVQGAALRVFDGKLWLVVAGFETTEVPESYVSGLYQLQTAKERIYIKDVSSLKYSDNSLYDPVTNPKGWKLIGEQSYVFNDTHNPSNPSGIPFDAHRNPYHSWFFNASGTECVSVVETGASEARSLVKWSITNLGYSSSATFSIESASTSYVSADYVGNARCYAEHINDGASEQKLIFSTVGDDSPVTVGLELGQTTGFDGYFYLDPRNRIAVWRYGDFDAFILSSGIYIFANGESRLFVRMKPGFLLQGKLLRGFNDVPPRVSVAAYNGHVIAGIQSIPDVSGDRLFTAVYFSGGDLKPLIGGSLLPDVFSVEGVRVF